MENARNDRNTFLLEKPRIYRDQLLTIDDFADFKKELLSEIKSLLRDQTGHSLKKWLKSGEVRKLLNISPGTLQNLRVKGILPFTKVGGVIYHDADDIHRMLNAKNHQLQNAV